MDQQEDIWKTVTDAWNGYQSMPLQEYDFHLTTFVTPFGHWCYKGVFQGFLSSSDGYIHQFDDVFANFDPKEHIIYNTIFYDDDLEEHSGTINDFLATVGRDDIVLNPNKF